MEKGFEVFELGKTTFNEGIEGAGEYVYGYVDGQRYNVTNTPEQISAFIMKYRLKDVMIVSLLDIRLIETSMGFIMFCSDQEYLQRKLIPVLAPMQMGEAELIEFVPHSITDEIDYVISNVRMQSGAGYFLGSLYFEEGYPEPYGRDSGYFRTEKEVQEEYSSSISYGEALEQAQQKGWID